MYMEGNTHGKNMFTILRVIIKTSIKEKRNHEFF